MSAEPELRFGTIVADPPWDYGGEGHPRSVPTGRDHRVKPSELVKRALPYEGMTLEQIKALPVAGVAAANCRLFLWTTNRYLPAAFEVLEAWGFTYRQTIVWHKAEGGPFNGSVAPNCAEFLLVAHRGRPPRLQRWPTNVIRQGAPKRHSAKPEVFLDIAEQCSPGPRLEMFARRGRIGWEYWGNESLQTVELGL